MAIDALPYDPGFNPEDSLRAVVRHNRTSGWIGTEMLMDKEVVKTALRLRRKAAVVISEAEEMGWVPSNSNDSDDTPEDWSEGSYDDRSDRDEEGPIASYRQPAQRPTQWEAAATKMLAVATDMQTSGRDGEEEDGFQGGQEASAVESLQPLPTCPEEKINIRPFSNSELQDMQSNLWKMNHGAWLEIDWSWEPQEIIRNSYDYFGLAGGRSNGHSKHAAAAEAMPVGWLDAVDRSIAYKHEQTAHQDSTFFRPKES